MPNRPCPHCHRTGRLLVESSAIALVEYYRCDHCGEVWVLDKRDPTLPPRFVTQPKPESEDPA